MRSRLVIPVVLLCFGLVQCAGYRVGYRKPAALAGVASVHVPMAMNETMQPRAETVATSAVANALVQEGTYRLAGFEKADAILECTVADIDYSTIRGSRVDTLLPIELANKVTLKWTLRDAEDPTRVLAAGSSSGRSQLFVSANLQTARSNALTEAMERAANQLVARMANGF